ncbi:MAG: class I SAM-dependent methyltransferase, partial [Gammaproteobacteria bacterium]
RYDYIDTRFKVLKIVFNEGLEKGSLLSRFIVWLANINPHRYETYLSHLYPLDQISFHLKKI